MQRNFKHNRIKELRHVIGITQGELSINTGIQQANISRWEKGLNRPNIMDCWRLADYFGVTIDYLIGRYEE
ncbi:MAG: helix-turn-helix transcriptional regulator [Clostridia bacterium]|nr:helix-turn-helix transcriptional regulator [Clostridia bacterium]